MSKLELYLFGRFQIRCEGCASICLEGQKVQELLCYLLVHPGRFHFREKLAAILWENSSDSQAKQYLRRTLWQLQAAIDAETYPELDLIVVDADWLQINGNASYWCDVTAFEAAFREAEGTRGRELDQATAQRLEAATGLYKGALLEQWYQEWCIVEREHLENCYLTMLAKLMAYCEANGEYERGIHFGAEILRCDLASEQTYRRLMRLHYLAGDRTGALRRYERCVTVLREELDVAPGKQTTTVYEQIKADQLLSLPADAVPRAGVAGPSGSLVELLHHLEGVQASLARAQCQVRADIERIRTSLSRPS